jgi:hypothetical protein
MAVDIHGRVAAGGCGLTIANRSDARNSSVSSPLGMVTSRSAAGGNPARRSDGDSFSTSGGFPLAQRSPRHPNTSSIDRDATNLRLRPHLPAENRRKHQAQPPRPATEQIPAMHEPQICPQRKVAVDHIPGASAASTAAADTSRPWKGDRSGEGHRKWGRLPACPGKYQLQRPHQYPPPAFDQIAVVEIVGTQSTSRRRILAATTRRISGSTSGL